ncbi:MAG: PEP-CTERM sorting domain-containing protein [Isosphaeraceae bacterium]
MFEKSIAIGVLAGLLATSCLSEARAGYTVVSLGVIPGGSISSGAAINASGEVVGSGETQQGQTNAFRGDGGTPTNLYTLPGGRFSAARSINASGVVVGDSEIQTGQSSWQIHAFRMSAGGAMEDLGVPLNARASHATGINAGGLISGYAQYAGNATRGFVSGGPGDFAFLSTFHLGGNSMALGLNDRGQIVGAADLASGVYRAFVTTVGGPLVDLGTLGGAGASSYATAINKEGVIAGYAGDANGFRAFKTRPDGTLQDLGALPGASSMTASGINARGDVVGTAASGGIGRAFLHTDLDGLVDLNLLLDANSGWILNTATGINDQGQITGTGQYRGQTLAYRLDPSRVVIPEPSALALIAIGLTTSLAMARRRPRP